MNKDESEEKKKVYICIPTYNEAGNIERLIKEIKLESTRIYNYEIGIIVIDDNSPDGTGNIIEEIKNKTEEIEIQIIHNENKAGLGKAYIQGFKLAIDLGAYAVMEMDADFSHDPNYVSDLIDKIKSYDFVIGSRYIKGGGTRNWPFSRKFISFAGNLYAKIVLLTNINDLTGGFNLYRTEIFKKLDLDSVKSNGYSFQIELKFKAKRKGFSFTEVPIIFKDREAGDSKFDSNIIKEAIFKPWRLTFGID